MKRNNWRWLKILLKLKSQKSFSLRFIHLFLFKVSITFDPFLYLPVPFPKSTRTYEVYYYGSSIAAMPEKICVIVREDAQISDLKTAIAIRYNTKSELVRNCFFFDGILFLKNFFKELKKILKIKKKDIFQLVIFEVFQKKIYKVYDDDSERVTSISPTDSIFVFESLDAEKLCEPVLNIFVVQRLLATRHAILQECDHCGKYANKVCTACYSVAYCNE